jgi:hypothetical protein
MIEAREKKRERTFRFVHDGAVRVLLWNVVVTR